MRRTADTGRISITSEQGHVPLSRPEISGNEWAYVKDCLDSGWVSSAGPYVERFEKAIAAYIGASHTVAAVNGTAALHLALLALGVKPGDEVIVPSITFVATANAVAYTGARPVFMDCEEDTLCVDTDKTIGFLKKECEPGLDGVLRNRRTGAKVAAMVPVHVFGHPAEMDALIEAGRALNVSVVEDSAQALGSEYKGKKAGSIGTIGCLSFNGNKIMTCGGGGMVATGDENIARRVRHLSTQAREAHPYEFGHLEVGYNYRLSALLAAVGLAQTERLDEFVSARRRNAALYRALLSGVEEVEVLREMPWARSNFWLSAVKVDEGERTGLIEHLASKGIEARPLWRPINTLPAYRGCQTYFVEKADSAYMRCVNLPSGSDLSVAEIERVAETLIGYFRCRKKKGRW